MSTENFVTSVTAQGPGVPKIGAIPSSRITPVCQEFLFHQEFSFLEEPGAIRKVWRESWSPLVGARWGHLGMPIPNVPPDSRGFHQIPGDPTGFQRLPLDPRGSHWNPDYPRGSHWIPEDPSGFQRIPPDSRSSHWIPEAPNAFQRIPVDSRGSHQIPEAPSGFQRFLLDSGGSHRIPEDPTRFQNLPPSWRHLPEQRTPRNIPSHIPHSFFHIQSPGANHSKFPQSREPSLDISHFPERGGNVETLPVLSQRCGIGDSCTKSPLDILHFPGDSRNIPDVPKFCD